MGHWQRLFTIFSVLAFSAACGVKGPPLPPESRPDPKPTPSASPSPSAKAKAKK